MLAYYVGILTILCFLRLYLIMPKVRAPPFKARTLQGTCSLAVFLGSGGHTSEILKLLSNVDFSRYTPRTYIISEGDNLSAQKAMALEVIKVGWGTDHNDPGYNSYTLLTIPRARRVHQSLLSTPPTALRSLATCLYHVMINPRKSSGRHSFADVLLLNGPGTCLILCIAVYANRFFGLPAPKVIYVESFARVRKLSISGRLLRPWVDRFVVQWPELLRDHGRGEYHGWLV